METIGRLAGGVAHDFNNLLMGILGHADLAQARVPPSSPVYGHLLDIQRSAIRAGELTRQLLAYAGKRKISAEWVDLSELVEGMAALLSVSIPRKVGVNRSLARGLPAVRVDATQIRQVVLNQITNAAQAIGDGHGTIRIETGAETVPAEGLATAHTDRLAAGCYVYVEVLDTGSGIDPAMRQVRPSIPVILTSGFGDADVHARIDGHAQVVFLQKPFDRRSLALALSEFV